MGKLVFTNEEKREIEKSIGLIMDDIRNMWQHTKVNHIMVGLSQVLNDSWNLEIDDKEICLTKLWYDDVKKYQFEKNKRKGSIKKVPSFELAFNIIKHYDESIRPLVEQEIKESIAQKGEGFEKIEAVKQQYDKHAEIAFEVGDSNNPPIIVLGEEDGKNIGTLYLGNRSLKIIVDGPIKIINKTTQEELASVERIKDLVN